MTDTTPRDTQTDPAAEVALWRGIADALAQEIVKAFDGHRTTGELEAYAAYLRAKG